MANTYQKDSLVKISVTFKVGLTDTDPTAVSLALRKPDGVVVPYTYAGGTVTKTATGKYEKNVSVSLGGPWSYRWEGTGTCEAAVESHFMVIDSDVE